MDIIKGHFSFAQSVPNIQSVPYISSYISEVPCRAFIWEMPVYIGNLLDTSYSVTQDRMIKNNRNRGIHLHLF